MFEYRQVITRMRLGDTDRAIARAGLMGRRKAHAIRRVAEAAGWLDPSTPLPDNAELACGFGRRAVKASSISLAEPFRDQITQWWKEGLQGTTIHAALVRRHDFRGSYSSVRRFVQNLEATHPRVLFSTLLCKSPAVVCCGHSPVKRVGG